MTRSAFGVPDDARRCALCSTVLMSWWEAPSGAAFCTDCAQVATWQRDAELAASTNGRRRRQAPA